MNITKEDTGEETTSRRNHSESKGEGAHIARTDNTFLFSKTLDDTTGICGPQEALNTESY